jgi:putative addiction module component (TIGR02574 family)
MNTAELSNLSVNERLRMMEALWSSLQRDDAQGEVIPQWHDEELSHRLARADAGQEPMMPLAQAKALLQQDIAQFKSQLNN